MNQALHLDVKPSEREGKPAVALVMDMPDWLEAKAFSLSPSEALLLADKLTREAHDAQSIARLFDGIE